MSSPSVPPERARRRFGRLYWLPERYLRTCHRSSAICELHQDRVIEVMLCSRSHGMGGQNYWPMAREVVDNYGRERHLSRAWIPAVQEKWSYSQREAEPSMQRVWPSICLGR